MDTNDYLFNRLNDREYIVMLLKKLKLHNFRGYEDIEVNFDDNFSVLIGRNDVGKSTILEALEIFFNSEQVKLDVGDLYVKHKLDDSSIIISCEFFVENDEVVIDSSVTTKLSDEFLYNSSGLLEICCESEAGKKPKYYINAFYPKAYKVPLVQMKIVDLRKELEKRKSNVVDYDAINKTVSSEIRKAIYSSENLSDCEHVLIDLTKEDAKNIYNSLQKQLPLFFLFKADRENKDGDVEVQNPLRIATKNVLKGIENDLEEIKKKIEKQVTQIGDETIEKMKELDPDIAERLRTSVNTKAWDSIFSFELIDDYDIPLNKRGSGVRRLLLLSYLRAEAERRAKEKANTNIIYAIEEPETAQHPDYQKKLIESIIDLSENPLHQIIITTHTPEIAKLASLDQIIFIKKMDKIPKVIENSEDKLKDIINTLGMYDNSNSKVIVCVEGENDINFLMNIGKIEEFKNIVDLSSGEVAIVPMHGGTLKSWIQRDYLKDSNVKEIHLYDSDVEEYKKAVEEMNKLQDGRRYGFITEHYEMENYIPRKLVEGQFNIDLSEYADDWGIKLDIPKLLVGKVGKTLGRDDAEREKRVKMILNGSVMKQCTYEMIKDMGNENEIRKWFEAIREAMQ